EELKKRVIACAEGAAIATGAKLEWHEYVKPYQSYLPNNVLGGVVRANMEALGRTLEHSSEIYGSTDFGNVSQVIPTAYALFRSEELKKRVIACAEGAAIATGAKLEWHEYVKPYQSYLPNNVLGGVVRANMEALGRTLEHSSEIYGSTDFGNVSQVIPTAYALF